MNRLLFLLCILVCTSVLAQSKFDLLVDQKFRETILLHKKFVSIPNLPDDEKSMNQNITWTSNRFEALGYSTSRLVTSSYPILLAEKVYDPSYKTILFYFHLDGQPINPASWDQSHPFEPVLKEKQADGTWVNIDWDRLNDQLDDDWRIFARSAADDKAPIVMFLTALEILEELNRSPRVNVKIIFDPEEEYGSGGLLSTVDEYQKRYAADYFIVMDGPAHDSNKPTLTFGCRGIAVCTITTYGPKLPQHSGHYGNYAPNPVFRLSKLLASMKDDQGRVLIKGYYDGISIDPISEKVLKAVPFDVDQVNNALGIHASESVGQNYQESLQFPSLNVRQIGTSWRGEKPKTVLPEYATANIDVRLVPEIDGAAQLEMIRQHLIAQGYHVIDHDPTDEERLQYDKIVKFMPFPLYNAFRTDVQLPFGQKLKTKLADDFGEDPILIRMMGGTVPIIPLINKLDIPTVIVPMVNMDNNQHNPNENIRLGNIRAGIKICGSILTEGF